MSTAAETTFKFIYNIFVIIESKENTEGKCVVCKQNFVKMHPVETTCGIFCRVFLTYGCYEKGEMNLSKKGWKKMKELEKKWM